MREFLYISVQIAVDGNIRSGGSSPSLNQIVTESGIPIITQGGDTIIIQ